MLHQVGDVGAQRLVSTSSAAVNGVRTAGMMPLKDTMGSLVGWRAVA